MQAFRLFVTASDRIVSVTGNDEIPKYWRITVSGCPVHVCQSVTAWLYDGSPIAEADRNAPAAAAASAAPAAPVTYGPARFVGSNRRSVLSSGTVMVPASYRMTGDSMR